MVLIAKAHDEKHVSDPTNKVAFLPVWHAVESIAMLGKCKILEGLVASSGRPSEEAGTHTALRHPQRAILRGTVL